MTTYIFPGQGSQMLGMGRELFTLFPDIVAQADAILGYSIQRLCLEDSNQQLNQTQFTQPALYTVNALHYLKKQQEAAQPPNFLAGHSLGEYNALLAAGAFDFVTGLRLVKQRGELMGRVQGGGMLVVVGLTKDHIKNILAEEKLAEISIANYNSYTQVVLSGPKALMSTLENIFQKAQAMLVVQLKVSGAFHSKFMESAQQIFADFLGQFKFNPLKIPVIANLNAEPYQTSQINDNLAKQISNPVQWVDTINYLVNQGETDFIEIGPGNVLTGLVRRIKNKQ